MEATTGEPYIDMSEVPNGCCPNHAIGVTLPAGVTVTPLQDVD